MTLPWGTLTGIRPVKIVRRSILSGCENPALDFMEKYRVSHESAALALEIAEREIQMLSGLTDEDIGLYISIPFCITRCLYCSFVTNTAGRNLELRDEYVRKLEEEIEYTARILADAKKRVAVIYIGGGTPTALTEEQLERLTAKISDCFGGFKEYTVECGRPDTITRQKLKILKKHHVDRICINPQSMNDDVLKIIGRAHKSLDIVKSFELAREEGFENINMDIIAGLPGDNINSFKKTVESLLALSPEGVTVHTMSIKRGSRLFEMLVDRQLPALSDEEAAQMVSYARNTLIQNGLEPYYLYRQKRMLGSLENVGYAKSGFFSLYNVMIMEETSTIAALGAGAVSKVVYSDEDRIERVFNLKEPKDYIERFEMILQRKDKLKNLLNTFFL